MFKNRNGQLRSGWKITIMMLITIVLVMISGVIVYMIQAIRSISQSTVDGSVNMDKLTNLIKSDYTSQMITMGLQEILFILVPLIIWRFFIKRPLSNMGLTSIKKNYKDLIVGLLFGIVSISFVFVLLILTGNAIVATWAPSFSVEQLIYIPIFISVGFAEEIFTRGYIMSTLRQTQSATVAVLVSSVIFALMHGMSTGVSPLAYLNLALVGILFALMYLKSGNIWMCIGYHITWNYFQGNIYGFKVSGETTKGILTTDYPGNNLFNGGAFGPEGGLFVTVIILLGVFFVLRYYRNCSFDFIASDKIVKKRELAAAESTLTK